MGQTRLSSVAIICIERSYANRILQVSIDRIIDIFGKKKNGESFMRPVNVLFRYILGEEVWFNSLSYVLILYKQHCVCVHILRRCNVRCSLYKVLPDCLNAIVLIKPFIMDLYFLISCIPISTNRFTQKCDCFQNYSDIFFIS